MESRKFEIIQQLMDELKEEMQYGEEDLSTRLGRPKPDLEVVKIEGEMPMGDDEEMMDEEMESPEDKLKSRLMKMRGA